MDLRALLVTFPLVLALNAGGARGEDEIAAAEAAFREGRQLMKRGKYAEACLKFEASQALDPAAGTLLNLANCHEELGKTASAWAEFTKVADLAAQAEDEQREAVARRRADALRPRLTRLLILVEERPPGLEVTRDETEVTDLLGIEVAVDPGDHVVAARAPAREPWKKTIAVFGAGETITVEIPALEPTEARTNGRAAISAGVSGRGSGGSEREEGASSAGWRRSAALIAAGAGVFSIATGVGFVLHSRSILKDSRDHCDRDNVCDPMGYDLVKDAQRSERVAAITLSGGVLALLAGGALWLTASPRGQKKPARARRVVPLLRPTAIGLIVESEF